jgi:hypothetical protein
MLSSLRSSQNRKYKEIVMIIVQYKIYNRGQGQLALVSQKSGAISNSENFAQLLQNSSTYIRHSRRVKPIDRSASPREGRPLLAVRCRCMP